MKSVTSKKGASIFEASFCLVESITIYAIALNLRKDKSVIFGRSDSEFNDIIELVKSADEITVFESSNKAMLFLPEGFVKSKVEAFAKSFIGKKDILREVFIFTKPLEEIRALAKEIRTDKAVAKATKIPAKPKAGIKDRKDTI